MDVVTDAEACFGFLLLGILTSALSLSVCVDPGQHMCFVFFFLFSNRTTLLDCLLRLDVSQTYILNLTFEYHVNLSEMIQPYNVAIVCRIVCCVHILHTRIY